MNGENDVENKNKNEHIQNIMPIDRFVMGIKNFEVQQRLLENDPKTLLEAVDLAATLQMTMAERAAAQVQVVKEDDEICAVRPVGKRSSAGACFRCGNLAHEL